jgi:translocation and assembly module TamB
MDADVTFDDARDGRSRILATGEAGTLGKAGGFQARALRIRLDPLQVALARVARPSLPVGGTITGSAMVDGSSTTRLQGTADLVHRDRGDLTHVIGRGTAILRGERSLDVDVQARPLSLNTVGRFAPAAGLQGTAAGTVRAHGPMRDLALDARFRLPDGGRLDTRGRLDLASKEPGYDLATVLTVFNLRSVAARGPATALTATASAKGRGFTPATMQAAFAADVSQSAVDSVPLDSAHVRVAIANGVATFDSVTVRGATSRVDVDGTLGLDANRDGQLAYRVRVDSLAALRRLFPPADTGAVPPSIGRQSQALARARADSARRAERAAIALAATGKRPVAIKVDSLPSLRRDSLAGSLYAAGAVRGNISAFDVRGRLAISDVIARGNIVRKGRV